MAYENQPN